MAKQDLVVRMHTKRMLKWARTCSPRVFLREGYWRLSHPMVSPELIRDALQIIVERTKRSDVWASVYEHAFGDKKWYGAVGETNPRLYARAAEYAATWKGGK